MAVFAVLCTSLDISHWTVRLYCPQQYSALSWKHEMGIKHHKTAESPDLIFRAQSP